MRPSRNSGPRYSSGANYGGRATRSPIPHRSARRRVDRTTDETFIPNFLDQKIIDLTKVISESSESQPQTAKNDAANLQSIISAPKLTTSSTFQRSREGMEASIDIQDIVKTKREQLLCQTDWSGVDSVKRTTECLASPKQVATAASSNKRVPKRRAVKGVPFKPRKKPDTTITIGETEYLWSSTDNSARTRHDRQRTSTSPGDAKRRKISQTPSSLSRGFSLSIPESPRINLLEARIAENLGREPLTVFQTPESFHSPQPSRSIFGRSATSFSSEISSSVIGQASQPASPNSVSDYENIAWRQWLQACTLGGLSSKDTTAIPAHRLLVLPRQPDIGISQNNKKSTELCYGLLDYNQNQPLSREISETKEVDIDTYTANSFPPPSGHDFGPSTGDAAPVSIPPERSRFSSISAKSKEECISEAERSTPNVTCDVTLFGAVGEPTTAPVSKIQTTPPPPPCTRTYSPATLIAPPPMLPHVTSADRQPLECELNLRERISDDTPGVAVDENAGDIIRSAASGAQNARREQPGTKDAVFRFHQPEPFVGRLAALPPDNTVIKDILTPGKRSSGGGRTKRSTAMACAKVNIRLVPNFEGDPIDDDER